MTIIHDNNLTPRAIIFSCDCCQQRFERSNKSKPRLEYNILNNKEHYCSLKCSYQSRKPTKAKETICNMCSVSFLMAPCKKKETNFCSRECYWEYRKIDPRVKVKRKPCSEKTKEKIGAANKGKQPRLGAVLSEETKEKISKHHKETGCFKGDKNPMYGKTHTDEIKQKMSEIVSSEMVAGKRRAYGKNYHEKGYVFSTKLNIDVFYRSSWEKATTRWLDQNNNVKTFTYEPFAIPYIQKEGNRDNIRHYVPDFLVEYNDGKKELWEIKPLIYANTEKARQKQIAAEEYCKLNGINGYRILTKEDLKSMNIL
jgi:hypothetical protein